jgi:hypothetical protein
MYMVCIKPDENKLQHFSSDTTAVLMMSSTIFTSFDGTINRVHKF